MDTLHGKNIVVYDLEIKNEIKNEIKWSDHHLMGISVGVAYHYLTSEYIVFMDDNLHELVTLLNQADIVSGFNIIEFDNKLLRATSKETVLRNDLKNYDLLLESRIATGWRPSLRFPTGMKLDDHLLGTFGEGFLKTANGAEAPLMYQRNEIGKLVSYCIADVKRECMLFEHVYAGKPVTTLTHGSYVLRKPVLDLTNEGQ